MKIIKITHYLRIACIKHILMINAFIKFLPNCEYDKTSTSIAIVLLSLAVINDSSYSSVIAGGGKDKHKDKHDKGNICGGLVTEFEKLNDFVNDETLTDEQFDAVEDLRLFLVFKLHCVDESEGFEWS